MSWVDLEKYCCQDYVSREAVTAQVCLIGRGATKRSRLRFVIRRQKIDDCPAWIGKGASVSVQLGEGEHAGLLRIVPGGPFVLCGTGGPDNGQVQITIQTASSITSKPKTVEFDYGDRWLEITLPDWAKFAPALHNESAPAAKVVVQQPRQSGKTKGFSMIGQGR